MTKQEAVQATVRAYKLGRILLKHHGIDVDWKTVDAFGFDNACEPILDQFTPGWHRGEKPQKVQEFRTAVREHLISMIHTAIMLNEPWL